MWPSTKNMQIVYRIDHLSCRKRKLRLVLPHLAHLIQLLDKYHDHTLNQTKKMCQLNYSIVFGHKQIQLWWFSLTSITMEDVTKVLLYIQPLRQYSVGHDVFACKSIEFGSEILNTLCQSIAYRIHFAYVTTPFSYRKSLFKAHVKNHQVLIDKAQLTSMFGMATLRICSVVKLNSLNSGTLHQ